jgi:hypothetical protein
MEPLQDEELPFGELMDGNFTGVAPSMEEAELLGTATMNLVDSGMELARLLDKDGNLDQDLTPENMEEQIRPVIFWANQLRELMQIQVAKAGNGMQI